MLQWVADLETVLHELWQALIPDGNLIFSIVGEKSLHELKISWAEIDNYPHVHNFCSNEILLSFLENAGFKHVELIQRYHYRFFSTLHDLMMELKTLGAHSQHPQRQTSLLGKTKFVNLQAAYEKYRGQNGLPVTYEIYYVIARK
jgi:hypothetical protein